MPSFHPSFDDNFQISVENKFASYSASVSSAQAFFLVPCGKFSGPNGVQAERLHFGGPTLLSWLTIVFNSILATGIVPASFAYDHVVPLLKSSDNDPSVPSNYRGITLTSVISKILSTCFFHVFSLIFSRVLFRVDLELVGAVLTLPSCSGKLFPIYVNMVRRHM